MKTKLFTALALLALTLVASCGSSKEISTQEPQTSDVYVLKPCSGEEFMSNDDFLRANAMASSNNMETANQKALVAARSKLATNLESILKSYTDSYIKSTESYSEEEAGGAFQSLSTVIVNNKMKNVKVICDQTMQDTTGMYKCFVAVEIPLNTIVEQYQENVSEKMKINIEDAYQKFKEVMSKYVD